VTSRDVIFDEAFMLKQNEAETCDDSPQEKLTVEVEFDENSSPSDKGDARLNHSSNKKSPIQLLKVERNGFTKHQRDMALKTWLALLS